jgi:hypothetical protein
LNPSQKPRSQEGDASAFLRFGKKGVAPWCGFRCNA